MRHQCQSLFVILGLCFFSACAVEEGGDEFMETDCLIVSGQVLYANESMPNVQLGLFFADDFDPVAVAVSSADGSFALEAGKPGDYYLLAGYSNEAVNLMNITDIWIQEQDLVINLVLNEVEEDVDYSDDRMPISSDPECYVKTTWWKFCYECCRYPNSWYYWCGWTWCG